MYVGCVRALCALAVMVGSSAWANGAGNSHSGAEDRQVTVASLADVVAVDSFLHHRVQHDVAAFAEPLPHRFPNVAVVIDCSKYLDRVLGPVLR